MRDSCLTETDQKEWASRQWFSCVRLGQHCNTQFPFSIEEEKLSSHPKNNKKKMDGGITAAEMEHAMNAHEDVAFWKALDAVLRIPTRKVLATRASPLDLPVEVSDAQLDEEVKSQIARIFEVCETRCGKEWRNITLTREVVVEAFKTLAMTRPSLVRTYVPKVGEHWVMTAAAKFHAALRTRHTEFTGTVDDVQVWLDNLWGSFTTSNAVKQREQRRKTTALAASVEGVLHEVRQLAHGIKRAREEEPPLREATARPPQPQPPAKVLIKTLPPQIAAALAQTRAAKGAIPTLNQPR